MEVVLFIGIPASGKSSFYRERFAGSHLRVNRDMLKTRYRELSLYQWCLEHEQSCVIDNTNSTREVRTPWLRPAQERGLKITGYFFQSRIQDCLERNRQRRGADRIPDVGVRDHHARLELPSLEEGFTELHFVSMTEEGFTITPWHHEV
ncbi:AAA family ATPase [Haloferula sp. BvORR071]|uniref:AAA family ATPase n=1 Tax=Haloferula sp. BvORR071 TaxID=1396141 RepID=UPI000557F206|nr:AAA family ATPase [Haloferula sp. BvORR071]